jgi:hypothetical protein
MLFVAYQNGRRSFYHKHEFVLHGVPVVKRRSRARLQMSQVDADTMKAPNKSTVLVQGVWSRVDRVERRHL